MANLDVQKIGRYIAEKRKEKGLTQVRLGEELGVTGKTISRWENGNYMPDLSLIIPLSEILGVSLNELLNGESIVAEENTAEAVAEKAEQSIVNTIVYSNEKMKQMKRQYALWLAGVLAVICLVIAFLYGMVYAEVPYQAGDTTEWEVNLQNHSAYEMALSEQGEPVFTHTDRAMKKAKSDYSDAIEVLKGKYNLLPFSKFTYKWYIDYCNETEGFDERVQEQLAGLKSFIAIYDNSFQWKQMLSQETVGTEEKGEMNITVMQSAFVIMVVGSLMLIVTACTEGMDAIGYVIYKGRAEAKVLELEEYSIQKSRRLVEKEIDENEREAIWETVDKNVHYVPFRYKNYKKTILGWSTEETKWRARYPYLRKQNVWEQGETLELHYSLKKPWRYAVCDKHLWIVTGIKCVAYIGIVLIGVLLLVGSV